MTATKGQAYHTNQIHYLRLDFDYTQETTLSMGWLPAGAVVVGGGIVVSTAFNSGTSDTADIGYRNAGDGTADDTDEFMTAAVLTAAGFVTADEIDASVAELYFPEGTEVVVTYASGGTAPSAGQAHAFVSYLALNE